MFIFSTFCVFLNSGAQRSPDFRDNISIRQITSDYYRIFNENLCDNQTRKSREKKITRSRISEILSRKVRNFGDSILYTFARGSTRRTSTPEKKGVVVEFLGVLHPPPAEHANAIIYYLVIVYRRHYARTLQLFSIVWRGWRVEGLGFLCLCLLA